MRLAAQEEFALITPVQKERLADPATRGIGDVCVMVTVELRKTQRIRKLKAGTIAFDQGGGINCVIRNISNSGACLDVSSPLGIPDNFMLISKSDQIKRPCHIVWRSQKQIGVSFT